MPEKLIEKRKLTPTHDTSKKVVRAEMNSKVIKVYLAEQIVEDFEGSKMVFEFICVTGSEGHETNPGNFHIIRKPKDFHYISKTYNVPMNYPLFLLGMEKPFINFMGRCLCLL